MCCGWRKSAGYRTFSLVGHDWGGMVAWWLALRDPDRIERLVILNAPHPGTMGRYAIAHPTQMLRSWYILFFQIPGLPEALLRVGGYRMARHILTRSSRGDAFSGHDLDALPRCVVTPRRPDRHDQLVSGTPQTPRARYRAGADADNDPVGRARCGAGVPARRRGVAPVRPGPAVPFPQCHPLVAARGTARMSTACSWRSCHRLHSKDFRNQPSMPKLRPKREGLEGTQ